MLIKNIDSFMTIGNSHEVCEDYVYHSFGADPYIILADGCSSSKDTDIGARVLVHSARKILNKFVLKTDAQIDADTLGDMIVNEADEIIKRMMLRTSALDATLIMMYRRESKVIIHVFGDGNVFLKKKDGTTKIYNYQYAKNMPYYLSYYLDASRQHQYCKEMFAENESGKTLTTTTHMVYDDPQKDNLTFDTREDFVRIPTFILEADEYEMIAIASDGIESFFNPLNSLKTGYYDVLKELTAYKGTVGEFVKRRCKRAVKNYHKEGIEHYDDVSFGAMLIGENDA